MDGDITEYIGTDYPVMGYGAQQSLSGSALTKDRLNAELTQLLLIRATPAAAWNSLVDDYSSAVIGSIPAQDEYSHPPSGTSVGSGTIKFGMFGGFQVWLVEVDIDTLIETWHFWGPSNKTMMSINGPEPKPMLMDPTGWMIGTGDISYLNGGVFTAKHKFGGDAILAINSVEYYSENDETSVSFNPDGATPRDNPIRTALACCRHGRGFNGSFGLHQLVQLIFI